MLKAQGVLWPVLALIGLNLVAHFLPFERVSLSGDDICYSMIPVGERAAYLKGQFSTMGLRRPFTVCYFLLHWFVGESKWLWVTMSFLFSSVLTAAVYFLMRELAGSRAGAFLCSAFFVLLPNKDQIYQHLGNAYLNPVYALTVVSLTLFLVYLRSPRAGYLWGSFACYAVSIFFNELGFFLPFIFALAAFLYGKPRLEAGVLALTLLAGLVLWRLGYGSGIGPPLNFAALSGKLWDNFRVAAPNHYIGRQMMKATLYGIARFPAMELRWLFLVLAADGLLVWGFFRWFREQSIPRIPAKALLLSAAMWVLFILPAAMGHGILSRHTALASLGFSVLTVAALRFLLRSHRFFLGALTLLFGVFLIASQGAAWNHVVSCRMTNAFIETFQEKSREIRGAERVLIDQYSFSQKIPYTWVKDPLNQLDTYWGVDALVGENFGHILHGVCETAVPVEVVRGPLSPGQYPRAGTVLIDYTAVYPNGFQHGNR